MLIQMPRDSADEPRLQDASECSPFEAALRRDLATAPVFSYDATLGGWSKRTLEFLVALLTAPAWLPLLGLLFAWSKLHHPARVFERHEGVGYGGRHFTYSTLRLKRPNATVSHLDPSAEVAPEAGLNAFKQQAEASVDKWTRALAQLPQLINVLMGEMALVGPSPLTHDQLTALKVGKRHYLSARPGIIGVGGVVDSQDESVSPYKVYAMAWGHDTDALIIWDAARALFNEGELWRPQRRVLKPKAPRATPRARRAV